MHDGAHKGIFKASAVHLKECRKFMARLFTTGRVHASTSAAGGNRVADGESLYHAWPLAKSLNPRPKARMSKDPNPGTLNPKPL